MPTFVQCTRPIHVDRVSRVIREAGKFCEKGYAEREIVSEQSAKRWRMLDLAGNGPYRMLLLTSDTNKI